MNFTMLAGLILSAHGHRLDDGANLVITAADRRFFGNCLSQIAPETAD